MLRWAKGAAPLWKPCDRHRLRLVGVAFILKRMTDISILTTTLTKQFKSYRKEPGIAGSIRSFFKRTYVVKEAVSSFDMKVQQGEIVGLLGPNGAGKTTLMKMMTGIIYPSGGDVRVLGYTPFDRPVAFRKSIALVMGQKSQLWWDIPAMDSLLLLQRYYEIPEREFQKRLGELAELLDVRELLNVHIRKLSLGERMKMELMASLLHEPKVIFLDEPTIGLDIVAQNNVRRFLLDYHALHKPTIILTSHYMADVEALCPRIVLIIGGKKEFDGPIRKFETILGRDKWVSFIFSEQVDRDHTCWQTLEASWNDNGTRVDLKIPEDKLRETSSYILQHFPVVDFRTEKLPIERVMDTLLSSPKISHG